MPARRSVWQNSVLLIRPLRRRSNRPHGPQMSAEAVETWGRMRSLLEEVAEIAQSLSEEDMMVVEALMETWMQENPV